MDKFVHMSNGMAKHPSGGFYKASTVDNKLGKLDDKLRVSNVYALTLEDQIIELNRVVNATTQVIDDLQQQLRVNKAMRKDARVYQ